MSNKKTKKHIGYIIAIVLLSVGFIVTGTVMGIFIYRQQKTQMYLSSVHERAYYELLEDVNEIQTDLSKAVVANGKMQKQYLMNISNKTESACCKINSLPFDVQSIGKINQFVNKVSGYSKHLASKSQLEDIDYKNLSKIFKTTKTISQQLHSISAYIGNGYNFSDSFKRKEYAQNPLSDMMNALDEANIEYPELSYDSDKSLQQPIKGLNFPEISSAQGEDMIRKYFEGSKIQSIEFCCETKAKNIDCFSYNVVANNVNLYVQLSKNGGKLILFDAYKESQKASLNQEQATQRAEKFVEFLGFKDMKAVWFQDSMSFATINLVPVQDDILLYPDTVKVKIDLSDGTILGMEAIEYYTNHTQRKLEKINMNTKDIKYQISKKLKVISERVTLLPLDGKEILTIEITAEHEDMMFYIYVDAKTKEQVKIYKVIDTEQGSMVI